MGGGQKCLDKVLIKAAFFLGGGSFLRAGISQKLVNGFFIPILSPKIENWIVYFISNQN